MPERDDVDRDAPDLDALLAQLRQRVEDRRTQGAYPGDLEATLDEHFDRLVGERPRPSPAEISSELEHVVHDLTNYDFSRARIEPSSNLPGGRLAHRAIGKGVSRQVDGVLQQAREHAALVTRAIALLDDIASSLGHEFDTKVLQQLDDLQVRMAEQTRALRRLEQDLADARERLPGAAVSTWYDSERFTAVFRGTDEVMRERYSSLAHEFVGCDPVLDVGFGRGEFMQMLAELGVKSFGIEADPDLVARGRGFGLDVGPGLAVDYLRGLEVASLGGIVMLQVVEHLSPQQLVDLVELIAQKVRPGGKVVIETVNPTSLSTYTNAFWIDPDHVRPVPPQFLEFLFGEAGFAQVRIDWRTPLRDDERLAMLPGGDELTRRLNENFTKLNDILFAPQDYALVATR